MLPGRRCRYAAKTFRFHLEDDEVAGQLGSALRYELDVRQLLRLTLPDLDDESLWGLDAEAVDGEAEVPVERGAASVRDQPSVSRNRGRNRMLPGASSRKPGLSEGSREPSVSICPHAGTLQSCVAASDNAFSGVVVC